MTLQLLFFGITVFGSLSAIAAQEPNAQECPKPYRHFVAYPVQAIRNNITGEAAVAGRFDDCGRIIEVVIRKKSGNRLIDNAAVETLQKTILSEAQRSKAVDGYYETVISYGIDNNLKSAPLDWPKSHRNPRYVVDNDAIGFASVEAANNAIIESNKNIFRPPVYNFAHRIVQFDTPTGREFWLFVSSKGGTTVAARYRPVIEDNQPVVKLAVLCELEKSQCEAIQGLLMRGLPMAPARQ